MDILVIALLVLVLFLCALIGFLWVALQRSVSQVEKLVSRLESQVQSVKVDLDRQDAKLRAIELRMQERAQADPVEQVVAGLMGGRVTLIQTLGSLGLKAIRSYFGSRNQRSLSAN